MKRLLFLGAGLFQLDGIRVARELGYHVITVDNVPRNVGHELANESFDVSTTNIPVLLELARDLQLDGVFTMASDVALPATSALSSALGLVGPSTDVTDILTNKERFREFQAAHGLPHPRFASASSYGGLLASLDGTSGPFVLKPAASSGSRGVTLVDRLGSPDAAQAFERAIRFSRSGTVLAEELVPGEDITMEGFLLGGERLHVGFTSRCTRGFTVHGHACPPSLSLTQRTAAIDVTIRHFEALGYTDGPFDADLKIDGERVQIIEISPRLGGNGVPWAIEQADGAQLVRAAILQAMGEEPETSDPEPQADGCYSVLLTSDRSGRLLRWRDEQEVRARIPGLLWMRSKLRTGMAVQTFRHGGDVLGFALIRGSGKGAMGFWEIQDALMDALGFELEGEGT